MEEQIQDRPCRLTHTIDKVIPAPTDLYFANRVCDCGKLYFYAERCSCPASVTPTFELKSRPNESYIPQS